MASFRKKSKTSLSVVPETPPDEEFSGRSRRQSTIFSSVATKSAMRQSAGSPGGVGEKQVEQTVVQETPDLSTAPLVESDDSALFESSGVKLTSRPRGAGGGKVGRVRPPLLDISGVEDLDTSPIRKVRESASKRKRDRRRSDLPNREEFLQYLDTRSPPSNIRLSDVPSEDDAPSNPFDVSSSDEEIDWNGMKTKGQGSIQKFLGRKSIVISGNIKSKTKKLLSSSKPKKPTTTRKNLENCLKEKEENTIKEDESETSKNTPLENGRGRSSSSIEKSGNGVASYQDFSTDSAKALIAALKAGEQAGNRTPGRENRVAEATDNGTPARTNTGRKRGAGVLASPQGTPVSKRSRPDRLDETNSTMVIATSVKKVERPILASNKKEKTSLTPQSMVLCESPVRRSGRDSTRISTIATENVFKSPCMESTRISTIATDNVLKSPTGTTGSAGDQSTATQCPPLMEGVVVWVEYRNDSVNQTSCIQSLARELGARVEEKLTLEVTHVIFKDGSQGMFNKAKKRGLPILAMRWLDESKKAGKRLPETAFPSVCRDRYNSPGLFPRIRKMRSMQPKTLEEDHERAIKSNDRRRRRMEKKRRLEGGADPDKDSVQSPIPNISLLKARISDSPLEAALAQFQSPTGSPRKITLKPNLPCSPESPSDKDYDTPLAQRLANRYQASPASPLNSPPSRRSGRASTKLSTMASTVAEYQDQHKETIHTEQMDQPSINTEQNGLIPSPSLRSKPNPRSKPTPSPRSASLRNKKTSEESPNERLEQYTTADNAKAIDELNPEEVEELYKELLPSPVKIKKPRKKKLIGSPTMESTRIVAKVPPVVAGKSTLPVGKPIMESTRMTSPRASRPSLKSPMRSPREIENDIMFDNLISGKTPSPTKPQSKEPQQHPSVARKLVESLTEEIGEKILPQSTVPLVPTTPTNTLRVSGSPATPSPSKTPRVVAPWRHLNLPGNGTPEGLSKSNLDPVDQDDVYEFPGFPDDPPSSQKVVTPSPIVTRRRSKGEEGGNKARSNNHCTSWGRPVNRMFMVAPGGGPGPGTLTSKSTSRSPLRSPLTSPVRVARAGPEQRPRVSVDPTSRTADPRPVETRLTSSSPPGSSPRTDRVATNNSPRTERVGSPRSQDKTGSPRTDRISSPRAEHYRNLTSLQVDLATDKPGISLTGLASGFDIVASVSKFSTSSNIAKTSSNNEKSDTISNQTTDVADPLKAKKSLLNRIFSKPSPPTTPPTLTEGGEIVGQKSQTDGSETALDLSSVPSDSLTDETPPTVVERRSSQSESRNSLSENRNSRSECGNSQSGGRRKHKLFPTETMQAGMLDQTADPSAPLPDTSNLENVHATGNGRKSGENSKNKSKGKNKEKETEELKGTKKVSKKSKGKKSSKELFTAPTAKPKKSKAAKDTAEQPEKAEEESEPRARRSRRSTMDFAPLPARMSHTADKSLRKIMGAGPGSGMVLTSCHSDDKALVRQLVRKFGQFSLNSAVTSSTSHVVSGERKRTMSVLKALLRGCWILSLDWALASLEAEHWVAEEPFELVDFSPAVRSVRQEKDATDGEFKSELFREVGTVYISKHCKAPQADLAELVSLGGGRVAKVARVASVVVGELADHQEGTVDCVTEKWMLDSVQFHVIMPFSDYPVK